MNIQDEPDFKTLESNIIEVIKEEQIKLGYKSETIRLYYPMESINNLLGKEYSMEQLQSELRRFCLFVEERLGKVEYSNRDSRFCFIIPPSGVAYVHELIDEQCFLKEFIEKISEHNCSIDDILKVFYRHSDAVKWEKVSHGEFDYLIYFEDGKPDSYLYCIKFEECHAIYHRFTRGDYKSFDF